MARRVYHRHVESASFKVGLVPRLAVLMALALPANAKGDEDRIIPKGVANAISFRGDDGKVSREVQALDLRGRVSALCGSPYAYVFWDRLLKVDQIEPKPDVGKAHAKEESVQEFMKIVGDHIFKMGARGPEDIIQNIVKWSAEGRRGALGDGVQLFGPFLQNAPSGPLVNPISRDQIHIEAKVTKVVKDARRIQEARDAFVVVCTPKEDPYVPLPDSPSQGFKVSVDDQEILLMADKIRAQLLKVCPEAIATIGYAIANEGGDPAHNAAAADQLAIANANDPKTKTYIVDEWMNNAQSLPEGVEKLDRADEPKIIDRFELKGNKRMSLAAQCLRRPRDNTRGR